MKILFLIFLFHTSQGNYFNSTLWSNFIKLEPHAFNISDIDVSRAGRIVNGNIAKPGQFKEFVLMFVRRSTATVQCGGCLIGTKWVMTAKHCTNSAISIDLRFGVTNRYYYDQRTYATGLVVSNIADMSLILLQDQIKSTYLTKQAILPTNAYNVLASDVVTACGLGLENQITNYVSVYLQWTRLKVMSNSDAERLYGSIVVNQNIMCTVGSADVGNSYASTCTGDSGSPLFATINGQSVVVGIVSFGTGSCDKGYPTCHVRVDSQLSTISRYIQ
ncbi:brachyurin-like [Chironomus tepperi]|uniref:brachyurin-like n=1 Tax=Chironomus tepperi TaxID=113505 RepID=UPI00391F2AC7